MFIDTVLINAPVALLGGCAMVMRRQTSILWISSSGAPLAGVASACGYSSSCLLKGAPVGRLGPLRVTCSEMNSQVSTWSQSGVNWESTWSQSGVNRESTWSQSGVNLESIGSQLGANWEQTESHHGVDLDSDRANGQTQLE